MMSKYFIDQLLKREKKSAIINVSSLLGYQPCAGSAVYAASKGFVNYFSQSLAYEMRGKIDVQCLTPSSTVTNLLREFSKTFFLSASVISTVKGSLRDLGYEEITGGPLIHDIQIPIMSACSNLPFISKITIPIMTKIRRLKGD